MSIKVKNIKPEFVDQRGYISRIIDQDKYKVRSILYIKRKKGSRGADHYHKKDAHWVYVLEGKVRHSEKDMKKKNSKIEKITLGVGDLVFTPPMVAHSDEFISDSVILAFTTENRNQKDYKKDTVKVDFFKK